MEVLLGFFLSLKRIFVERWIRATCSRITLINLVLFCSSLYLTKILINNLIKLNKHGASSIYFSWQNLWLYFLDFWNIVLKECSFLLISLVTIFLLVHNLWHFGHLLLLLVHLDWLVSLNVRYIFHLDRVSVHLYRLVTAYVRHVIHLDCINSLHHVLVSRYVRYVRVLHRIHLVMLEVVKHVVIFKLLQGKRALVCVVVDYAIV